MAEGFEPSAWPRSERRNGCDLRNNTVCDSLRFRWFVPKCAQNVPTGRARPCGPAITGRPESDTPAARTARPLRQASRRVLCREAGGPGVNLSITTDDLCLDRHGGRVQRAHPTPHLKVHPQHRTVGQPAMPSARRCAHWTTPIGVGAAPVSRSYIDRRRAATPSSLSLKLLTNNAVMRARLKAALANILTPPCSAGHATEKKPRAALGRR